MGYEREPEDPTIRTGFGSAVSPDGLRPRYERRGRLRDVGANLIDTTKAFDPGRLRQRAEEAAASVHRHREERSSVLTAAATLATSERLERGARQFHRERTKRDRCRRQQAE